MRTKLTELNPDLQTKVLSELDNLLGNTGTDEIIDQISLMLIEFLRSENIVEKDKESALFIHSQLRFFFKKIKEVETEYNTQLIAN